MRIRPDVLLLAFTLPLVACKDYGDFTVAEREWVDNDELPALSEMDLTGINLEFAVGSEAHARVLPEADWPHPIGMLMDRMKSENGGNLPADFDLPLEDGCIYVAPEPQYFRFRRVEFQGRTLLFATYRLGSRISGVPEEDQPKVELRLTIIDESRGMARHDLRTDAVDFDLVRTDAVLGVVSNTGKSIHFRRLDLSGDALIVSDPVVLATSDHGIDRMTIATEPDGTFHLAWLTDRYAAMPERFVYYAYFDQDGIAKQSAASLSDSAVDGLLGFVVHDRQPLVIWTDSRFVSRGFKTTNKSKIMIGSADARDNGYRPPVVLNTPKDNSDNAYRPWLASPNGETEFLAWGTTTAGNWRNAPLQLGFLNLEQRLLMLAEKPERFQDIVAEATRQKLEHQRSMPIAGLSTPAPTECDRWQERLNLKPTGVHIRTPEGEQEIMKLDPDKTRDNRQ